MLMVHQRYGRTQDDTRARVEEKTKQILERKTNKSKEGGDNNIVCVDIEAREVKQRRGGRAVLCAFKYHSKQPRPPVAQHTEKYGNAISEQKTTCFRQIKNTATKTKNKTKVCEVYARHVRRVDKQEDSLEEPPDRDTVERNGDERKYDKANGSYDRIGDSHRG